jgi:hypothetical protein
VFKIDTLAGALLVLCSACSGGGGGDGSNGGTGGSSLSQTMVTTSSSDAESLCPALAAGSYTLHYQRLSASSSCPPLYDQELLIEADGSAALPLQSMVGTCSDHTTEDGCTRTWIVSCQQTDGCTLERRADVDRETWSGQYTTSAACPGQTSRSCQYEVSMTEQ